MKFLLSRFFRYLHYFGFILLASFSSLTGKIEIQKWQNTQDIALVQKNLDFENQLLLFLQSIKANARGSLLFQSKSALQEANQKIAEVIQQGTIDNSFEVPTAELQRVVLLQNELTGKIEKKSEVTKALVELEKYLQTIESTQIEKHKLLTAELREYEKHRNALQIRSAIHGLMTLFSLMLFLWILSFQSKSKDQIASLLHASERLHRLMFSSLNEGVLLCTQDGYISTHNRQAARLLNLPSYRISGLKFQDLLPRLFDQDGHEFSFDKSPLYHVFQSRKPLLGVLIGLANTRGQKRWLNLNTQPLLDEEDRHTQSVLISLTDITERIENEKKIQDQRTELAMKSKFSTLGEMATGIAHEINNPLALILFETEGLQDTIKQKGSLQNDEVNSFADRVTSTIFRMSKIIKGLKSYARDAKEDEFQMESVRGMIDDSMTLLTHRFTEYSIEMRIKVQPEDLQISCRSTQIIQILVNLIGNAVDAIQDSEESWIEISAHVDGDLFKLSVSNSGPMIPENIQENLFKPFFTTKQVGKGTGLGLSLSKNLAQEHQGSLYLKKESKFTCFELIIPVSQVQNSVA